MLNSIVHHCNIYKVLKKMKFIVAADTQIGLYSHFSNIKDKSEIRTNSIEFVKLDFLNFSKILVILKIFPLRASRMARYPSKVTQKIKFSMNVDLKFEFKFCFVG